jgi:ectoine hydroxylase-related dioxygenase (phytanoyl-CoA dioxygenase family)
MLENQPDSHNPAAPNGGSHKPYDDRGIVHLRIEPGDKYRGLQDAELGRPLIIELNAAGRRGPKAYDGKTLRRVFGGVEFVFFDQGTVGPDWHQAIADTACNRGKAVLVRGAPRKTVDAWVACAGGNAPGAVGVLPPSFKPEARS